MFPQNTLFQNEIWQEHFRVALINKHNAWSDHSVALSWALIFDPVVKTIFSMWGIIGLDSDGRSYEYLKQGCTQCNENGGMPYKLKFVNLSFQFYSFNMHQYF